MHGRLERIWGLPLPEWSCTTTDAYILQAFLVKGMARQERRLREDGKALSCSLPMATATVACSVFARPDANVLSGLRSLGQLCQVAGTDAPWAYRNVARDIIPVAQGILPRSHICRHDQALLNAYFTVDSNNAYQGVCCPDIHVPLAALMFTFYLQSFCHAWWSRVPLPCAYNTILYEAHQAYGVWNMQGLRDMGVVVLHFVYPKPEVRDEKIHPLLANPSPPEADRAGPARRKSWLAE